MTVEALNSSAPVNALIVTQGWTMTRPDGGTMRGSQHTVTCHLSLYSDKTCPEQPFELRKMPVKSINQSKMSDYAIASAARRGH